ncbi:DMT family transporter [Lactococcus protaetiae]|uniref:EamA family transporter n=1 Tax=Lactococcus protaetiae TaxID=2592653 RepID=A0A514ZAC3_9LACT|nr:DMT family transporter [Lactococcus protaetiae]MCL2113587.1 DMT family transporter [Streptococcaceae bacterium]QDK71497.1 EamA family transporter [Lactococcus protaetiae]
MNVQKRIFKGTLFAVIAGCMWGISGIFGQLFFRDYHGNPLWITSTRLTVAGIILLGMSMLRSRKRIFDVWKSKKNMPILFLYVFGGVFSVQYFYYVAIQLSNSATATILQYVAPVFIMLYLLIFRRQIPKFKSVIFVILAMLGVFLLITNGNVGRLSISPMALLAGLLAAVAVVIYSIVPRPLLDKYGALNMTGWGMFLAGVGSNIFYPVWRIDFHVDALAIFYILTISIVGTAVAFLLLLRAYQLISPLVVSVATATEPLTSVFVSIPLFGLKLTPLSIVAIIIVIISVILLSKSEQT